MQPGVHERGSRRHPRRGEERHDAEQAFRTEVWLGHLGATGDAIVGAIASVLINNLPATTLLSAERPEHPLPLLIGLNLGPNLLFTGSLSTFLWYQAAHADAA
ncbi:MAG TPA: hypothetical protein VGP69_02470 [Gaiellaceae bacterium]|nr:hypothetical protein [Gaiellaceae bacterium]